jgi:hypothetical protein
VCALLATELLYSQVKPAANRKGSLKRWEMSVINFIKQIIIIWRMLRQRMNNWKSRFIFMGMVFLFITRKTRIKHDHKVWVRFIYDDHSIWRWKWFTLCVRHLPIYKLLPILHLIPSNLIYVRASDQMKQNENRFWKFSMEPRIKLIYMLTEQNIFPFKFFYACSFSPGSHSYWY